MTPKPESETDPWAKVRTFAQTRTGLWPSDSGRWYCRTEVDAARAAEAAQHQHEIADLTATIKRYLADAEASDARLAAVEAERDAKSRLIAELEGEAKDLKYHPISGIYAIEAERDRLKAAAQAVLDNGTCADPDCCKAAIKHEAALVELRATLSGEGTAKP